jgi:hypothetical protein
MTENSVPELPGPHPDPDGTVAAGLAKLAGKDVGRCSYCGVWAEAGPYVTQFCDACGSWFVVWLPFGDAGWKTNTELMDLSEPPPATEILKNVGKSWLVP